jgi:hypothetical protein
MSQQEIRLTVLARIPDLNGSGHVDRAGGSCELGLPRAGRLLGQAVSCKLLAGITLFLLVGAAIPFSISKSGTSATATPPSSSPSAPVAAMTDGGVVPQNTVSPKNTNPPVVVIPAVPEKADVTAKIPMAVAVKNEKPASQAELSGSPAPMMTKWTYPGVEGGPSVADNSVPPRKVEYKADLRGGSGANTPFNK